MAIYVDDSMIAHNGRRWCRLTADTLDDLHEFADELGLKRAGFQERDQWWLCHYEVTAANREKAITLGAIDETWQESAQRAIDAARARMLGETPETERDIELRSCRECGCTEENACWHDDIGPCQWVEGDLCSACGPDADDRWDHPFVLGIHP